MMKVSSDGFLPALSGTLLWLTVLAGSGGPLGAAKVFSFADPTSAEAASARERENLHSLELKLERLRSLPLRNHHPVEITDREANSYFKHREREVFPQGVSGVELAFGPNRIEGWMQVDFTELKRSRAQEDSLSGWLVESMQGIKKLAYRLQVTGEKGQAQVEIESATFDGVELPLILVEFMVNRYVESKYNLDLDKPFPLPKGIERVVVEPSRMLIYPGQPEMESGEQ
jgi:hypothetical protein